MSEPINPTSGQPGPTRDQFTGAALVASADRHLIRAHSRSERYVLVEVTAPTVRRAGGRGRPAVNLAYVLDRSGSMSGHNKLGLAKQAVIEGIDRQDNGDQFAVVLYDHDVDIVAATASAITSNRRAAADSLSRVEPRGNTNLSAGWLAGCEQVATRLQAEGVNRVLLLTDGLANAGVIDADELGRMALDLRRRGITTSTFGVGTDFNEQLLQSMADAGGGHFYFIGDLAQMRDHITSEVGEALDVVAREAVLELTVPESVRVETLSPHRVEQRGDRVRVYLGDLVSGQVLAVVLRLRFDFGELGRELGIQLRLTDRDGAFEAVQPAVGTLGLHWVYADHAANDAQVRNRDVDRVAARYFAGRARQEAVALNRQGMFKEAAAALASVRRRIEAYAGTDDVLREIVASLRSEAVAYANPMAEMDRKSRYASEVNLMRSRSAEGKSLRREV